MRKVICALLVVIQLYATTVLAATTDGRNALEFIDLFNYYLIEIEEGSGIDTSFEKNKYSYKYDNNMGFQDMYDNLKPLSPLYTNTNEYWMTIPVGDIVISIPEFEIVRAEIDVLDIYAETDSTAVTLSRAVAAYAALEYDYMDEWSYSSLHKSGLLEYRSALDAAMYEFTDAFDKALKNDNLYEKFGSVVMITKKYRYSLTLNVYEANEDTVGMLTMIVDKNK